jgi:hypothetical protein
MGENSKKFSDSYRRPEMKEEKTEPLFPLARGLLLSRRELVWSK